jgi:pimeloyl-ACP methyl ester carboxylesterase
MMAKNYLWTASLGRIQLFRSMEGRNYNWLFLPGGPGLGSESLFPLLNILELPGNMWRLDLPGDGSNTSFQSGLKASMQNWSQAIGEAVTSFDKVILVAHSRGGMFALSLPELEKALKGIVLLDTAPDRNWQEQFALTIERSPLPEAKKLEEAYNKNPNDESLKRSVLAFAPYMFTQKALERGIKALEHLPYNHEAYRWALENFDPIYEGKWVPKQIPTMILSGAEDIATPLELFTQKKEFDRPNIFMREIKNARHFPWIDNPQDVMEAFKEYVLRL